MLIAMTRREPGSMELLLGVLPDVFFRVRFLRETDVHAFAVAPVDTMRAADSLGNSASVAQLLIARRHTAEVDTASAKGWEGLARQARENCTYRAWTTMPGTPGRVTRTPRHHRPTCGPAHGAHRGQTCEQWGIEVTGGGRIRYLLDTVRQTCRITVVGTGDPRTTDGR
jgi:hypothetical protein